MNNIKIIQYSFILRIINYDITARGLRFIFHSDDAIDTQKVSFFYSQSFMCFTFVTGAEFKAIVRRY